MDKTSLTSKKYKKDPILPQKSNMTDHDQTEPTTATVTIKIQTPNSNGLVTVTFDKSVAGATVTLSTNPNSRFTEPTPPTGQPLTLTGSGPVWSTVATFGGSLIAGGDYTAVAGFTKLLTADIGTLPAVDAPVTN